MDIWEAAKNDDLSTLKKLLASDPSLLDRKEDDEWGCTPLRLAARNGAVSCVKHLLEAGANPDIRCNKGFTPLYRAAEYGHVEAVRLLLEHHANPDIQTSECNTALMRACCGKSGEIIDLLMEHNANPKITNNIGKTAWHYAEAVVLKEKLVIYETNYQPRVRKIEAVKTPSVQANLARLDKILKDRKKPENAAAGEDESWLYLPPSRIVRVDQLPAVDLCLKEIFDFEARRQTTVTEDFAVGSIAVEHRDFDDIKNMDMVEKALEKFTQAGGNVDPGVLMRGYCTRKKGDLDGLKKSI